MRWPEIPAVWRGGGSLVLLALLAPASARAQSGEHMHAQPAVRETTMSGHPHMRMHMAPGAGDKAARGRPRRAPAPRAHGGMAGMTGHEHPAMPAMYGPYGFAREASGTAWQPESAPHRGWHVMRGDWSLMMHGSAFVLADRQGGPRGDDQLFSTNMFMGMASRPLGAGRLGLRGMVSLEPFSVGRRGYPLLLQTGETADGRTHLIDRQHPHDLAMELAAAWSVSDATRAAFIYVGLPGEPALGPPGTRVPERHSRSGDSPRATSGRCSSQGT